MLIEFTRSIVPSFLIAWVVVWLLRTAAKRFAAKKTRWLRRILENLSPCVALAAATNFGVLSLQDVVGVPSKFWHWVGLASVLCLIVQTARLLRKSSAPISLWTCAAWGLCALVSAWFLVPTWSSLTPSRPWFVGGLTLYLTALSLLYEYALISVVMRGTNLELSRQLIVVGAVTALVLAATIAVNASLTYAALTAVIGASGFGILLGYGRRSVRDVSFLTLFPCLGFMLGVAAFVGMVYPQPPIYRLLLLPLAPLAVLVSLRFAGGESRRDVLIRYGVAAIALALFAIFAVV